MVVIKDSFLHAGAPKTYPPPARLWRKEWSACPRYRKDLGSDRKNKGAKGVSGPVR